MTQSLFIFGMGYTATRLAAQLRARGWDVSGTTRTGDNGTISFADHAGVSEGLARASHILSSVPPAATGHDPVLTTYGETLRDAPARWVGYLSSTGVYGDTAGAWVDESAPIGSGRRSARAAADAAWQSVRADVRVFRLPGIYGPERSALDRVRAGRAHRVDLPNQIFSRVHVDDIVRAIVASFAGPAGIYNLTDDLPAPQNHVIAYACALLGMPLPPLIAADDPALSPLSRKFYDENRRVANGRAKRLLDWQPLFPDYRSGLRSLL